jgi:hypothetical protein
MQICVSKHFSEGFYHRHSCLILYHVPGFRFFFHYLSTYEQSHCSSHFSLLLCKPDPGSASKNWSIVNPKKTKLSSQIRSGMFITDPGSWFFPSQIRIPSATLSFISFLSSYVTLKFFASQFASENIPAFDIPKAWYMNIYRWPRFFLSSESPPTPANPAIMAASFYSFPLPISDDTQFGGEHITGTTTAKSVFVVFYSSSIMPKVSMTPLETGSRSHEFNYCIITLIRNTRLRPPGNTTIL